MPMVVIRRRDISPASAGEGAENAYEGHEFGKDGIRPRRQEIPKENQGESGA